LFVVVVVIVIVIVVVLTRLRRPVLELFFIRSFAQINSNRNPIRSFPFFVLRLRLRLRLLFCFDNGVSTNEDDHDPFILLIIISSSGVRSAALATVRQRPPT
jgi:hypothetical protein